MRGLGWPQRPSERFYGERVPSSAILALGTANVGINTEVDCVVVYHHSVRMGRDSELLWSS